MMRACGASVVLCIAGIACGQVVGVTIEIDEPVLAPGDSTTVRLYANFDPSDYAIAGVALDLWFNSPIAEPGRHWSDLDYVGVFRGPGPSPGSVGDTMIDLIIAGQLNFPPAMIYADPTNPIAFWQATFTAPLDAGGGYRVDLLTETFRFDVYIDRESSTSESRMDLLSEGSAAIHVVPAPASAAVLVLGLAAMRRRR